MKTQKEAKKQLIQHDFQLLLKMLEWVAILSRSY